MPEIVPPVKRSLASSVPPPMTRQQPEKKRYPEDDLFDEWADTAVKRMTVSRGITNDNLNEKQQQELSQSKKTKTIYTLDNEEPEKPIVSFFLNGIRYLLKKFFLITLDKHPLLLNFLLLHPNKMGFFYLA